MITINNKRIGGGTPCYIVFEAGATHDGLETAKALVSTAADAGADAVKFQIFDPDLLVSDKQMRFGYDMLVNKKTGETRTVEEPLYDILCRRAMTRSQWKTLKGHADALDLAFFATVGFESDIELLQEMGCDSIKIASADINHWPLIRKAAQTGMCIQLDTGNASLGEVEEAVDICRREGNTDIVIHNCPSGYPARLESINLNLIQTLKQMYPEFVIAFSDHTPGWEMDIAALAMGADLIEKTITLDRTIKSPEHLFSLEPAQMREFISIVRDVETAMGSPVRVLGTHEKENRLKYRRSVFLNREMEKGQTITLDDVVFRRPGTGMGPDRFEEIEGKHISKSLPEGHQLTMQDIVDI